MEYNIRKALEWCDVANVLRIQLERQNQVLFSSLREYNLAYGINRKLLDSLAKKIVIMHPVLSTGEWNWIVMWQTANNPLSCNRWKMEWR